MKQCLSAALGTNMINDRQELDNLLAAIELVGATSSDGMIATLYVECGMNSRLVLDRVRSLFVVVLRYILDHPFDDEVEPGDFTIDNRYWRSVFPTWFIQATRFNSPQASRPLLRLPEVRVGDSQWTMEGWLYWFLSPHEERHWRWISAVSNSSNALHVTIQVKEYPFAWESLRWALLAAGATSVELLL